MTGAQSLLHSLFDHVPVGLGVIDADLRYRRVNGVLAEINGRPAEDHVGRTVREVVGEPAADELETLLRSVLDTGLPSPGVRLSGPTPADPGANRHFVGAYVPVVTEDGGPGVLGIVSEVTAQRAADIRATEAASVLDAVYSAAPVGLAFWTPDLRFARINEELARINGRRVDEHIGRTLDEVLGDFGARVEAPLRQAMTDRRRIDVRYDELRVHEGAPQPGDFEATYYPVLGPEGDVLGVGGVVLDVTERHRAEAERARLLKEALTARAHAEAAQLRAEGAQEAAEAARARTEFLAEAGRRLAASMDIGSTLQKMADITVPAVADWCLVTLVRAGGNLENVAVAHSEPDLLRRAREYGERYPPDPTAPSGVARAIRTQETQLISEISDELLVEVARNQEHLQLLRELGIGAILFVPLIAAGETIGALTLIRSWGRAFSDDEVALAEELGARAALHVNNARLYSERSHIARALQAGLLPRALPEIPGLELAARYEAAGDQNQVGGDFYDVFAVPDDGWVAVIGDVSGKGPEAAAVTSLARHTLRTMLSQGAGLTQALTALNEALCEQVADRFCTVACARLEVDDAGAAVTLSTAGHPPPLVRRAGGSVETVTASGTLLGALPRIELSERTTRLAPGDLLLLYTDGLVELRGQDSEFGERWLPRALEDTRHGSPAAILEDLQRRATDLQGGVPRDDMALLALRVAA